MSEEDNTGSGKGPQVFLYSQTSLALLIFLYRLMKISQPSVRRLLKN